MAVLSEYDQLRELYAGRPDVDTVTIASSASESGALDLNGEALVGLQTPSAWTAADITFLGSNDNVTFLPMYTSTQELKINSAVIATAEARAFVLTPSDFLSYRYIKVRSGVNGTAVNQAAQRTITVHKRRL